MSLVVRFFGTQCSSGCQPNFAALNGGRHLYSAGRPSRWALAHILVTGSIARSARMPVFNLLRGRFWGFSPCRGDTLHRWGWNLAWRRGPKVPSSMPRV